MEILDSWEDECLGKFRANAARAYNEDFGSEVRILREETMH